METPVEQATAGPAVAVRPAASTMREHFRRTVSLAVPVIIARSGVLVLASVDTIMTGRYEAAGLAYLGLGMPPTIFIMMLGLGLLLGTSILTAQADGAGDYGACGRIWRVSMVHALVISIIAIVLCQFGELFLTAIGQDPALAKGAGAVMRAFGWGMPAVMLGVATTFFLEAIGRPVPGMIIMLIVNLVNFGLNLVMIPGWGPIPALGAEGAMLATSAARWIGLIGFVGYVYFMPDAERYAVRGVFEWRHPVGRKLRAIGYPLAMAHGLEMSAFVTMSMLAGYLGTQALAGYQVAVNLLGLVFMSAIGVATACGVRVGNAVGRQDPEGIRKAGRAGLLLVFLVMSGLGAVLLILPTALASIYSSEPAVIALAAAALVVVGVFLPLDGVQVVAVQALRGLGDIWIPTSIQVLSFWGLSIPAGAYFAFVLAWGPAGLMGGFLVGVLASALANGFRLEVVSKRPITRL
jgi:MATE family multidrug resistance protein